MPNLKYKDVLRTILWIESLESGEMIESRGYRKTHLSFGLISQRDLDAICTTINDMDMFDTKITNHMGEIVRIQPDSWPTCEDESVAELLIQAETLRKKLWAYGIRIDEL